MIIILCYFQNLKLSKITKFIHPSRELPESLYWTLTVSQIIDAWRKEYHLDDSAHPDTVRISIGIDSETGNKGATLTITSFKMIDVEGLENMGSVPDAEKIRKETSVIKDTNTSMSQENLTNAQKDIIIENEKKIYLNGIIPPAGGIDTKHLPREYLEKVGAIHEKYGGDPYITNHLIDAINKAYNIH